MKTAKKNLEEQVKILEMSLSKIREAHDTIGFGNNASMSLNFVESKITGAISDLREAITEIKES